MKVRLFARVFPVLVLAVCGLAVAQDAPTKVAELPKELKKALETAMQEKVAALVKEKDADGLQFKRASFSRFFKKVDDTSYRTSMVQDTVKGDQLFVERFDVLLKKKGDNSWEIGSQDLKQTYDSIWRSVPKDEKFKSFDAFTFDREGLKIQVSKGHAYLDFRHGRVSEIQLVGLLSYSYTPPEDVNYFQQGHIWAALNDEPRRKDELAFTPDNLTITCEPNSCDELIATAFTGLQDVSIDSIPSKLREEYNDLLNTMAKNRRDYPFSGFEPHVDPDGNLVVFEPERRYYQIVLNKKVPKKQFYMVYDNFSPWEVRVGSGSYGTIFGYYSAETRKSGVSEYELELRPDVDSRDFEIEALSGTVELALNDGEAMSGDLNYEINTKRDLNWLPMFISRTRQGGDEKKETKSPVLIVNALEDDQGRPLTYVRLNQRYAMVIFPEPVKAGTKLKLHLKFDNTQAIYNLNYSYSAMDRGGWLPFVRFGDMIDRFEMTVKVPARYKPIGIGNKVWEKTEGDVIVSHWKAGFPVTFPTVIFGQYEERPPAVALPKKLVGGAEVPIMVHIDKNSMTDWELTPGRLPAVGDQAANAIKLYTLVYGKDYPYDVLNLVSDPLGAFYGQAPASIIYLGNGVFFSEGRTGELGGSDLTKFNKDVVAHEVGHQWWGSLITNANGRNYWFVETMAEYSSALYVEKTQGQKAYLDKVAEWRRNLIERDVFGNVQNSYALWSGGAQSLIYNKGPYAFHILRETFGDEKFFRYLRILASELAGKEIVTRDIQAATEKAYGGNMDWFFDQWIRGVGVPELKWSYNVRATEDGQWLVEGKILQRVVVGQKNHVLKDVYYRSNVPVTIYVGKEETRYNVLVEGPETTFRLKSAQKPTKVALNDKGEALLAGLTVGTTW